MPPMFLGTSTLAPSAVTHAAPRVLSRVQATSCRFPPRSVIFSGPIRISHAGSPFSPGSLAFTPRTRRLVKRPADNFLNSRRSFLGDVRSIRCNDWSVDGRSVNTRSVNGRSVIVPLHGRNRTSVAASAAAGIAAAPAAATGAIGAIGPLLAAVGVNTSVLRASLGASFKLFSMCAFIVWLMKAKILPETTPSVLSQVAFQAMIPCFLMTKVASTLAVQPLASLAALPLVAVVQVLCGAALGKLVCSIAYHRPSSLASPPAARHIAFSVAQSLGLSPSAAAQLSGLPPPPPPPPPPRSSQARSSVWGGSARGEGGREGRGEGEVGGGKVRGRGVLSAPGMVGAAERAAGRKEAVVMSACAFGNSLTLPLVFLATLLSKADADRAAGYLALFMVGWSPTFWTLGYSMFTGGDSRQREEEVASAAAAAEMGGTGIDSTLNRVVEVLKKVLNPPIYGVLAGLLIGATPLGHFFLPASSASASASASAAVSSASSLTASAPLAWLFSPATAGILHPLMESAAILGSACVAVQAVVLASSLASSIPSRISLSWPKPPSSSSSPSSPSSLSSSPTSAAAAAVSSAIDQLLPPPAANTQVTALVPIPVQ
ncbi:hypothetical protein CLOP_g19466, partial [Closterium sp. NIES-67]